MAARKLVQKLTAIAVVPVIISMILFGGISYNIYKDQLIHQQINDAAAIISLSADEIKNPLYFMQLDKLNVIIENIKENPEVTAVYIMNPEGRVITDGTPENRFRGQIFEDEQGSVPVISGEAAIHVDKNTLKISSPVVVNDKIGTLRIDFSLKEMNEVLMNLMVLIGTIGAAIIIAIASINFSLTNPISKSIMGLRDAANEIAKGDFSRRTQIKSDDEIADLSLAFNKMAEGLQKASDERKLTEEICLENERLVHATRAKSEFLANMSHELRTPLNAIIGFSELMNMSKTMDKKHEHYLDNIITSSKFLLKLIDDILDLSKVEAGKIELVNEKIKVSSIIDETLTLIKEKASKHNVLLKKELDPDLLFIEADSQRFKQIMFNLLSNAVKFSKPEGGTVTIGAKKDGIMARFSVSDTGIGIKEDDLKKLYKEFEQLDSGITKRYGGTGLGLAISRKLVELHGGSISAESKYGVGTTFSFCLPIAARGNIGAAA